MRSFLTQFFLLLILSTTAPPCDAARMREAQGLVHKSMPQELVLDTHNESEEYWRFSCPPGLRANKTEEACYYDGAIDLEDQIYYLPKVIDGHAVILLKPDGKWLAYNGELQSEGVGIGYRNSKDMADRVGAEFYLDWGENVEGEDAGDWIRVKYLVQEAFMCKDVFNHTRSNMSVKFAHADHGGTFKFEEQFTSEMAVAMHDVGVLDAVGEDLMELELKRNLTFRENMHKFFEYVEQYGHNNKPVEFLVVHAGLHVAMEAAVHSLEVIAHAGVDAALVAVAESLVIAIPIVGLALFPIMAAFDAYKAYHHYEHKAHHAMNFAKRLVWKSDCAKKKISIDKASAETPGFLQEKVSYVCGNLTSTMMAKQIQRANVKLLGLMEAIAEMGRCLWPYGERSWAKTNCAEAVHQPLRSKGGSSGLLWLALSVAAAYAQSADELMTKPVYKDTFSKVFGVNMTHSQTMTHTLDEMLQKDMTDRAMGCMSMLATHRAFERIFARLTVAVKVWSRTFSREIAHRDIRMVVYSSPCRRVFEKMLEPTSPWHLDTCKDEEFIEKEKAISEDHPCRDEEQLDFHEDFGDMLWPEDDHAHIEGAEELHEESDARTMQDVLSAQIRNGNSGAL